MLSLHVYSSGLDLIAMTICISISEYLIPFWNTYMNIKVKSTTTTLDMTIIFLGTMMVIISSPETFLCWKLTHVHFIFHFLPSWCLQLTQKGPLLLSRPRSAQQRSLRQNEYVLSSCIQAHSVFLYGYGQACAVGARKAALTRKTISKVHL